MKKANKPMSIFKLFGIFLMSLIIASIPLFVNSPDTVFATFNNYFGAASGPLDKKVYYNGSVNDNFADDKVIIVLSMKETHKFLTYTPQDFREIGCVAVYDLTSHTVDYVKEQIENKKAGIENNENAMLVNVGNFRRILSLELKDKSKINVIIAIKKLERRPEILSAEPNHIMTIGPVISGQPWGI